MDKTVVELFAGVGGFRCGFNHVSLKDGKVHEEDNWDFVWANQWEPSTKSQAAFDCYVERFGESENHVNEDIATVDKKTIPNHTLLVGGFPCQDYSVARSLSGEKGIEGKKGVLWWQIAEVLEEKRPPFVLLENVDRLLRSPASQRGRDFGVMLRTLYDYGYIGLSLVVTVVLKIVLDTIRMIRRHYEYAPLMAYSLAPMLILGFVSYFFEQSVIILPLCILWGICMGRFFGKYGG